MEYRASRLDSILSKYGRQKARVATFLAIIGIVLGQSPTVSLASADGQPEPSGLKLLGGPELVKSVREMGERILPPLLPIRPPHGCHNGGCQSPPAPPTPEDRVPASPWHAMATLDNVFHRFGRQPSTRELARTAWQLTGLAMTEAYRAVVDANGEIPLEEHRSSYRPDGFGYFLRKPPHKRHLAFALRHGNPSTLAARPFGLHYDLRHFGGDFHYPYEAAMREGSVCFSMFRHAVVDLGLAYDWRQSKNYNALSCRIVDPWAMLLCRVTLHVDPSEPRTLPSEQAAHGSVIEYLGFVREDSLLYQLHWDPDFDTLQSPR